MADHKIDEWAQDLHGDLCRFNATIRDPAIQGVFGAFMYNFQWCHRLPFLISKMFAHGWSHGKADTLARRGMLGDDVEQIEYDQEPQIAKRRHEIYDDDKTAIAFPFNDGHVLREISEHFPQWLNDDIASLFSMQVVSAWSAFETLAGDLWVTVVNAYPNVLSDLHGSPRRIEKRASGHKPEQATDQGGRRRDAISLKSIKTASGQTYDLSGRMGALLAMDKTVLFTSLDETRAAYSRAFPENVGGVKSDEIDDALADKSLDALSLIRNLLVHRSGRADQKYIDDRDGIPDAPELELDHTIRLDGSRAKAFVGYAYNGAVKLTRGVDSWTTKIRATKSK